MFRDDLPLVFSFVREWTMNRLFDEQFSSYFIWKWNMNNTSFFSLQMVLVCRMKTRIKCERVSLVLPARPRALTKCIYHIGVWTRRTFIFNSAKPPSKPTWPLIHWVFSKRVFPFQFFDKFETARIMTNICYLSQHLANVRTTV